MTDELADKVRRERLRRDWSVRTAASAGGVSNTHWGNFEDYKTELTPRLIEAVATAFEWGDDWAGVISGPVDSLSQLRADHERLKAAVRRLALVLREELQVERDELLGVEESLATPDESGAGQLRTPS